MKTTACGVQRNLCMLFSPHWRHDLKPFLTSAPLTGNIHTCRHLTASYPLYHPDHECHLWTKLYYKWGPEWSRTASPFPRRRREKGGRRVLTVKSFGTGLGFVRCRLWRWSIMAAGTESRTKLGSQRSDLRSADDATNSSFWLDARWFYPTGILRECLVLFHFISGGVRVWLLLQFYLWCHFRHPLLCWSQTGIPPVSLDTFARSHFNSPHEDIYNEWARLQTTSEPRRHETWHLTGSTAQQLVMWHTADDCHTNESVPGTHRKLFLWSYTRDPL